jgi:tRNA(Ile)-lysidine synthase
MRLPIRVATALRARKLLPARSHVLVALSGGPDSVALLCCLHELARKRDLNFVLAAAHLNHCLRGKSSARDADFCRRLCLRLRVPFVSARCNVPRLIRVLKRSQEETARLARRAFLVEAARGLGCSHLAVAHHADDRIETVLYRLCRGTGLAADGRGLVLVARLSLPISFTVQTSWTGSLRRSKTVLNATQ